MVTFTSSEYQIDKLNVAYMLINWQKKMLHLINITSQLLVSGNNKNIAANCGVDCGARM